MFSSLSIRPAFPPRFSRHFSQNEIFGNFSRKGFTILFAMNYTFQMAHPAKTCIFCGKTKLTKEHVFPQWLIDLLPAKPIRQTRLGSEPSMFTGDITVKSVCADCNNVWMSTLEGEVRTLLGSMALDVAVPLDCTQQQSLAVWAVKTAFMIESMRGGSLPRFYSVADRQAFRSDRSIPNGTYVYLGRSIEAGRYANDQGMQFDTQSEGMKIPANSTTMVAGHVAFQIFTMRPPGNQPINVNVSLKGGNWTSSLHQIFPCKGNIHWPPKISLASFGEMDSVDALKRRFLPDGH